MNRRKLFIEQNIPTMVLKCNAFLSTAKEMNLAKTKLVLNREGNAKKLSHCLGSIPSTKIKQERIQNVGMIYYTLL